MKKVLTHVFKYEPDTGSTVYVYQQCKRFSVQVKTNSAYDTKIDDKLSIVAKSYGSVDEMHADIDNAEVLDGSFVSAKVKNTNTVQIYVKLNGVYSMLCASHVPGYNVLFHGTILDIMVKGEYVYLNMDTSTKYHKSMENIDIHTSDENIILIDNKTGDEYNLCNFTKCIDSFIIYDDITGESLLITDDDIIDIVYGNSFMAQSTITGRITEITENTKQLVLDTSSDGHGSEQTIDPAMIYSITEHVDSIESKE